MRGLMNDIFLDDLKAKTHRGMAGQALKGFSTGSRVYGYRRVPIEDPARKMTGGVPSSSPSSARIDEDKAQWVRQMFQWYADGKSLRWIASGSTDCTSPRQGRKTGGNTRRRSRASGSRRRPSGRGRDVHRDSRKSNVHRESDLEPAPNGSKTQRRSGSMRAYVPTPNGSPRRARWSRS